MMSAQPMTITTAVTTESDPPVPPPTPPRPLSAIEFTLDREAVAVAGLREALLDVDVGMSVLDPRVVEGVELREWDVVGRLDHETDGVGCSSLTEKETVSVRESEAVEELA